MGDRFAEAVAYWAARKERWQRGSTAGTIAPLQPGERVRGAYDLGAIIGVHPDGRVEVLFDEVDATGFRRPDPAERRSVREPWTLTRVPQDMPMAAENEASRRYWAGRA